MAGIKVDTARELVDKIKAGEIKPVGLGKKRQEQLEAYMERLFASLQEQAENEIT